MIAMTWEPASLLGKLSDIVLNVNSTPQGEGDGRCHLAVRWRQAP